MSLQVHDLKQLTDELDEIKNMKNVKVSFPDKEKTQVFIVSLKVDDGLYKDKWFRFRFVIGDNWPLETPQVRILDKIWHPNIDLISENEHSGVVSVSILEGHYSSFHRLSHIIESIQFFLINPNPKNAQNIIAASEMEHNCDELKKKKKKKKKRVDYYLD